MLVGTCALSAFMVAWILVMPGSLGGGAAALRTRDSAMQKQWAKLVTKFAEHGDIRLLHHASTALWAALAPLQLLPSLRLAYPAAHRRSGRLMAFLAAPIVVGYVLIVRRGLMYNKTFGGDVPLLLKYTLHAVGLAFTVAACLTGFHARARRMSQHRAWARRYVALGLWVAAQRALIVVCLPFARLLSPGGEVGAAHGKAIFELCALAGIALCIWAAEAANAEDARAGSAKTA